MKVILDLDTGIDDGMALAYTVGNQEMELIGVTGTYGNVYTEVGARNALNLLNMLGEPKIPVFMGATHGMTKAEFVRSKISEKIHGENGVGEINLPVSKETVQEKNGIDFLIESVKKYKKELLIIATGPLTNLAAALEKAPEILKDLGKVVIMGGALTVPGNVNAYAEANISKDPVAAKRVFESGADITMVGLDVTQRSQLTKEDTRIWKSYGTQAGNVYGEMVDYYISQHTHSKGTACYLHDPSAAICAVHPEFFVQLPMYLTVVTQGEAAGRTIGDPTLLREKNPNVKVCVGVHSEQLEKELKQVLAEVFQRQ